MSTTKFVNMIKAPLLSQLKKANLGKTAVFLGAGLDPDGLASQAAMVFLIEKWGGKSVSFYRGAWNRVQNKAIRQLFNLNPLSDKDFDPADDWTSIIMCDGNTSVCPTIPDFIIDHHEQSGAPKIAADVRPVGATSSLMWEYLMVEEIDWMSEDGIRLATLLAIGIKTDTKDGTSENTTDLDYDALCFCLKHKDTKIYKQILNFPKPSYFNDLFVTGWERKTIENQVLITGLGNIPEPRSGAISELATQFAETDGISTAIVFGLVDGSIDISVRSSNASLDVDGFVKAAFGSGGGKPGSGRSVIRTPLFENLPVELNEKLFGVVNEIVRHKALQIAGDKK